MSVNYFVLPARLRAGARNYIENHIEPSGVLLSCINNDFAGAWRRTDSTTRDHFLDILDFWNSEAPRESWGSERAANAWTKK